LESFTPGDLEALRKVALHGAHAAQQALQQMTGLEMELQVQRVQPLAFADVPGILGGPEAPVVGLHLRVYGDCRANVLLTLPPQSALKITGAIFPPGPQSLDSMGELERSALTEMGNVVTCAYLNALSKALRKSLIPSVPGFAHDMVGAVVDVLLIELGRRSDSALVLLSEVTSGPDLRGHLLLMPDPASLPAILEALRNPTTP
jgi:chemotaxis protein CheC